MANLVRPRHATFDSALRGSDVTLNILYIQVGQVGNMEMIETKNHHHVHALVGFIFFALLGFIQIRYPGNPTPFQLYPKTTMLSIASFLIYCLAFLGKLKFPTRLHHFETLMHVFGSLSLISLALMLLPHTWESLGFIVYILWFIVHVVAIIIKTRCKEIWLQVPHQPMTRVVPLHSLLPTISSMDLN